MDQALAELRRSRWTPGGWAAFLRRCGTRSAEQVRLHPRAALEVTVLHLALLAPGCPRLRLTASWTMAIAHLGLLGPSRSIGLCDALSLLRANLPAGRWSPLIAIGTDVADGWLARRMTATGFGAYADGVADVAFWTRQVWAREPSTRLRVAATGAWLLPLLWIASAYFASGRTIDYPRPLLVRRMMAGLQCLLAARALTGRLKE